MESISDLDPEIPAILRENVLSQAVAHRVGIFVVKHVIEA